MSKEEKQLLLKDLCARLPYGVLCHTDKGDGYLCSINQTIFGTEYGININPLKRDYFNDSEHDKVVIKPYLRPMSSMTEEEKNVFDDFCVVDEFAWNGNAEKGYPNQASIMSDGIDWLLSHHFDFRGLIEKGLALEAPEGMYKEK